MSDTGCWDRERGRQRKGPAWPGHVTPPVSRRLSTVLSRDGIIIHCQPIIYRHCSPIVPAYTGSKTRVGLDLLHCAVHTGG